MLKTLIAAFALLCLFTINSEARQRTYAAHPSCNLPGPNSMPCQDVGPSPRGERVVRAMGGFGSARKVYTPKRESPVRNKINRLRGDLSFEGSYAGTAPSLGKVEGRQRMTGITPAVDRPARYIAGRLRCAVNVGVALAERGIKGTGSALALSYLRWGHSAGGPVPGAVIVSKRRGGGHVAIVSRVENGVVFAWNATGGQRGWREIPYRHRVLDYRVPG